MKHPNYNHLLYFWTVVREGGVARAAESLHITPQTISGQIKLLEAELNGRLLEKKGRRGKVVTVISGLPADAGYLKTLTKAMKRQAASGGTQTIDEAGGIIELQGDHRDTAIQTLKDDGFQPNAA